MGAPDRTVALFDSYPSDAWRDEPGTRSGGLRLRALLAIAGYDPDAHRDLDTRDAVVEFPRCGDSALRCRRGCWTGWCTVTGTTA